MVGKSTEWSPPFDDIAHRKHLDVGHPFHPFFHEDRANVIVLVSIHHPSYASLLWMGFHRYDGARLESLGILLALLPADINEAIPPAVGQTVLVCPRRTVSDQFLVD